MTVLWGEIIFTTVFWERKKNLFSRTFFFFFGGGGEGEKFKNFQYFFSQPFFGGEKK